MHARGKSAPLALSVADAGAALGIKKTKLFQLLARGELRSIKIGARRLIPAGELERFVARRLAAAHEEAA